MMFMFSMLPSILPILAGLATIRKLSTPFRLVWLQIILSLSVHITCVLLVLHVDPAHANNIWVYNIYILPDLWLQSAVIAMLLNSPGATRLIIACCIAHLVCWAWNLYGVGWQRLVNYAYLAANILLMAGYLRVLLQYIGKADRHMFLNPVFMLCAASILYNCCSIPYLSMFNYLNEYHTRLSARLIHILDILDAIRLLICGCAFIRQYQQPQQAALPAAT